MRGDADLMTSSIAVMQVRQNSFSRQDADGRGRPGCGRDERPQRLCDGMLQVALGGGDQLFNKATAIAPVRFELEFWRRVIASADRLMEVFPGCRRVSLGAVTTLTS